jgi:hypothetical protein
MTCGFVNIRSAADIQAVSMDVEALRFIEPSGQTDISADNNLNAIS